ncbi:histidine phosphatase family protein [Pasteurella skyensis]|uniref:Histidine phosphatase family protein n=1 Tax=Phocoenobacter skyensis TaxID=97481 RepID=A0AAJ6P0T1_9PAST|nr:histidine phosphatase family protein [Pasteurella skyensis]MDP8162940.1 histidine phosphatase family protein [Pasteurella skyensis]MDP8172908.1 histidine phosphatase family protein [Pasteurella skyensis]MDP8176646.1 histidine phosphatase family protein [Pasteurella skyensis]MDP8179408.1 histidine phosphatase family protein [Pasteurella skyensis]MDP8183550.1 histidine phosphatase family protein [Pasteurella skyensis]
MIILVRHATPLIDYGRCPYRIAKERLIDYNETTNIQTDEIDILLKSLLSKEIIANKYKYIGLVSSLPRARKTAQIIFDFYAISYQESDLFREFELSIVNIPLVKLKTKNWFIISRILWFLGFNKGVELFKASKLRVNKIITLLNNHHKKELSTILVAHGLLNKFLEKQLVKDDWVMINKQKKGCFEYVVYDKYKG